MTPLNAEEKERFSAHLAKLIELYNDNFNPFRGYACNLAEISFGHGAYDLKKNDQVFYFDYPYSKDFGHITDLINDAQRGILPEWAKIDRESYKNLDIDIANIFYRNTKDAYILYKYIPINTGIPYLVDISSNLEWEKEETLYDKLIRYFFLIYHCTVPNRLTDEKKLFDELPQKIETVDPHGSFEYLLYFNAFSKISSETERQAITAAFIGNKKEIEDKVKDKPALIMDVYEKLFPMLDIMFNNPVLTYFNKQNAESFTRIETIKNLNRLNHILKTHLKTRIEPHVRNLRGKYPADKALEIVSINIRELQSISEFINLIDKIDNAEDESRLASLLTQTGFYAANKELSTEEMHNCLLKTIEENWNCYDDNPPVGITNPDQLASIPANFLQYRECHITVKFLEIIMLTVMENVIQHGAKTKGAFQIELIYDQQERSLSFKNKTFQDTRGVETHKLTGNFRVFNDLLKKLGIGKIELYQVPGTFEFHSKLINK